MRGTYRLRQIRSRLLGAARALPEIAQIARLPDHRRQPVARKPTYRRFLDLGYINLRWGELSSAYCAQGVDQIGRSVRRDYLPYPVFRTLRDSRNRCRGAGTPYDYVCLLQDKQLFTRYFGAAGLPVMPTVFEISPSAGLELDGRGGCSLAQLRETLGTPLRLFCKPRFGIHGYDAFTLDITGDGLYADGEATDLDGLAARIREPVIAQHRIEQHPELARAHPASVNTLRIVTCRRDGVTDILFASLKFGAGGHVTDNSGNARCVVRLDGDTGRLYETGYWKDGAHAFQEVDQHRESGVRFSDCTIPYFSECIELSRRAHAWLPGTHSVGWDLAVTEGGPVLLEGNDDWSGATSMNYADVRERFLGTHAPAAPAGAATDAVPAGRPIAFRAGTRKAWARSKPPGYG